MGSVADGWLGHSANARRVDAAGVWMCGDCHDHKRPDQHLTEINPPGGYGRPQLLVCDDCMRSGRWDDWKARHWPNWPDQRRFEGDGQAETKAASEA